MARRTNLPLLLLGLGLGATVAVYVLKKYTNVLEVANDRFRKAIKGTEFEDFIEEGEKRFARLEREVKSYVSDNSKRFTQSVKRATKQAGKKLSPLVKDARKVAAQAEDTLENVADSVTKAIKKRSPKKVKKSIAAITAKATEVLAVMTKNKQYTQKELADLTSIPYRSIRRYVEELIGSKKVSENGYGKGKRFMKA
jgi:vacuolar-type H+-ATPase subunit I/STV1